METLDYQNDCKIVNFYKKINNVNNFKSIKKDIREIDKKIEKLLVNYFEKINFFRNNQNHKKNISEFNGNIENACFIALSSYIMACYYIADEITRMKIKRKIIYFHDFTKYLGDVIDIWYDFFDIFDGSFLRKCRFEVCVDQYIGDIDDIFFNKKSLGYLLWKGDVNSIDDIVIDFPPQEIVNKCFFIEDKNHIFFNKLTERTGKQIDYIKILLNCKKYELLRSHMQSKKMKYFIHRKKNARRRNSRINFYMIIKTNCESMRMNVNLETIFYFGKLSFDNKGKINKNILYGIVQLVNSSTNHSKNGKDMLEFIEQVVDKSGKKYKETVYVNYLYSIFLRDDSEKLRIIMNKIVNVQFIQNNVKVLLERMVLNGSVKCIEYMKEDLKIKLVFYEYMWNHSYFHNVKTRNINLIDFVKFLERLNIPSKAIKINYIFRNSIYHKMYDCAEYIIDNFDIKLDSFAKKIFVQNEHFLKKYHNKFGPSIFSFSPNTIKRDFRSKYTMNFTSINSLIHNVCFPKKYINRILFLALIYGNRKTFYELKNKYPRCCVNFQKVIKYFNGNEYYLCINPNAIILAMEQFEEQDVLEGITPNNIKILFVDVKSTSFVLEKIIGSHGDFDVITRSFRARANCEKTIRNDIFSKLDIFNKEYFSHIVEEILTSHYANKNIFDLVKKSISTNNKNKFLFYNEIYTNDKIIFYLSYLGNYIRNLFDMDIYKFCVYLLSNFKDINFLLENRSKLSRFLGEISKFCNSIDENDHNILISEFGNFCDEEMVVVRKNDEEN
jgi:hypothetical protein